MKTANSCLLALLFMLLTGCGGKDVSPSEANGPCEVTALTTNLMRSELLQSFDEIILQGIASIDIPTSAGAMGRNKQGYFHVRFQMGIAGQSDYAVTFQNIIALEYAIKAIEYSFAHQLPEGDFELIVPEDLTDQTPQAADLASGVSFFLSSVGLALINFEESAWYQSEALSSYKARIELLRPKIALAAAWLLERKALLEVADQQAPNRLFFNALALYSLGSWLNDESLQAAGLSFATLGIAKKTEEGYFLEGDGWDSSYQGVALNVGFNLYSILPDGLILKEELWNCLSCASNWQRSRIKSTGEISTAGNVRVYPGGEEFLGQEKQVDWIKSMLALYAMGYYSNQADFIQTATRIKQFYE